MNITIAQPFYYTTLRSFEKSPVEYTICDASYIRTKPAIYVVPILNDFHHIHTFVALCNTMHVWLHIVYAHFEFCAIIHENKQQILHKELTLNNNICKLCRLVRYLDNWIVSFIIGNTNDKLLKSSSMCNLRSIFIYNQKCISIQSL